MRTEPEIYCPQCGHRPHAGDRWSCVPSCGTRWNTFWTRGVCPGCGVRWPQTECPHCARWSPHEDWYHDPAGEEDTEAPGIERPVTTP